MTTGYIDLDGVGPNTPSAADLQAVATGLGGALMFEPVKPDPRVTDQMPVIKAAYNRAINRGVPLVLMGGDFLWADPSEAGALYTQSNSTIIFAPDAQIIWGGGGVYYAPIVNVKTTNVEICNPRFLWTGSLTIGGDFYQADPSFGYTPVSRYGATETYAPYLLCAAIVSLESSDFRVKNLKGRSLAGNGTSVIHAWLFASRTDKLLCHDFEMNDCVNGVLTQGGNIGSFKRLECDRMSQDIGIPGHVLYTFQRDVEIEDIRDGGIETGSSARKVGHTVSYAGDGRSNIRGIRSRRGCGIINIKNSLAGGTLNNLYWKPLDTAVPEPTKNPAFYFVSSSNNGAWQGSNIVLDTNGLDITLFGGEAPGSELKMILIRTDTTTPSSSFIATRGTDINLEAKLIQKGNIDPPIIINRLGATSGWKMRFTLLGFVNPRPTWDITDINSNAVVFNEITVLPLINNSNQKRNPPFGSPDELFPSSTDFSRKVNTVRYENDIASYKQTFSAASTVNAKVPLSEGLYNLSLTLSGTQSSTGNAAEAWVKNQNYYVVLIRRGNNWLATAQAVGIESTVGTNIFSNLTVTPNSNGYCTITANVAAAGQADPHSVYVSIQSNGF